MFLVCVKMEKRGGKGEGEGEGEGEEVGLRIPFGCIEDIESTFASFLELEPTGFLFFFFNFFFNFFFFFFFFKF